jgi:Uma2 family endonuclease
MKRQYERFGIREYWILDEFEKKVTVFRLDARGKCREARARRGIHESQVLTGFWLDPDGLWQRPLPNLMDTLQRLAE